MAELLHRRAQILLGDLAAVSTSPGRLDSTNGTSPRAASCRARVAAMTLHRRRRPRASPAAARRAAVRVPARAGPRCPERRSAASSPRPTASPWRYAEYPVAVSIAWPTVCPRFSTCRRPPSRSSAATTASFVRAQARIIALVRLAAGRDRAPTARRRRSARSSAPPPSRPRARRGQRRERLRVDEHRPPAGGRRRRSSWPRQIHAGLAAVGGVDLGDQRRRASARRHAALVGGGAEPGEVADHAAAERHHVVGPRHPAPRAARATPARRWRASCAARRAGSRSSLSSPRRAP